MNTLITVETIKAKGVEKVARFAACIYVNYLFYMNGGGQGYGQKQIEAIEEKEETRVKNNFDSYVEGVVKALNSVANTETEKYFKKAYSEWYA